MAGIRSMSLHSAEEDAKRRDFTINGLFLDPIDDRVIDYVGGQEDLKAAILRAIGEPNHRFEEDHLRLLRAVRFASRFGLAIDIDRDGDRITRTGTDSHQSGAHRRGTEAHVDSPFARRGAAAALAIWLDPRGISHPAGASCEAARCALSTKSPRKRPPQAPWRWRRSCWSTAGRHLPNQSCGCSIRRRFIVPCRPAARH